MLTFLMVWLAAVIGTSEPAQSLTEARVAGMPPWEAYLKRSRAQMKADRAVIEAERKTAAESIPPHGKNVPLDKAAEWYKGAEAARIAEIIVSFQTPAGGWSKNIDLTDHARRPGESFAPDNLSTHLSPGDFDTPDDPKWNYVGTLDNDATTTEIQFLARTGKHRDAILRGIEYLLAAQFPNGGWPQVWPLEGHYHDAITFNDGAVTETIGLLENVADGQEPFAFVGSELRERARAAVQKAIECILATQIRVNGIRTVWAQQYDPLTLKPVAGRNYEPAAQCGSESAAMMVFLMSLQKPDQATVEAVNAAAAWFKKTAVYGKAYERGADGRTLLAKEGAGPLWGRFYEIGSDRPVFGDRDKTIHDDVNELSAERRNGYSYWNASPQAALTRYAAWSKTHR